MRGRSRRKKRTGKMVSLQKRFLAFMLAFAMIFTNVGTDLHVSFAASGNKVDFTIGGADLSLPVCIHYTESEPYLELPLLLLCHLL